MSTPPPRARPWPLLLAALAALLLFGLLHFDRPRRAGSEPPSAARVQTPRPTAPAAGGAGTGAPARPAKGAAQLATPPAGCAPRAARRCVTGDVHWVDACGAVGDKHAECGDRLCREGSCQGSDAAGCDGLTLEGACDGETVRGCVGGVPYARDCAALGKRCFVGDEGARCRTPAASDCDNHGELPRCEGERLLTCADGSLREHDCEALGARCLGRAGDVDAPAACVRPERLDGPPLAEPGCGMCGCPPRLPGDERCDGHDNDGDAIIDEGAECEPLDMVALLVTDAYGEGSHSHADIEHELERIHDVLGIEVVLADVLTLAEPDWLAVEEDEIDTILRDPRVAALREDVHVPVVFTDEVILGDAPKAGIATLPNGRCGGRRVSAHPEPPVGGVVLAKGRSPTTAAHEIGHFLGLCHTHFELEAPLVRQLQWPRADGSAVLACPAECERDGDGICDTPPDPGPERCAHDLQCQAGCAGGESPDASNAMSYYTACRTRMSPGQVIEMRRALQLRRGWHPCLQPGGCPCVPAAGGCPEQMTCRPATDGAFECGLDGPLQTGEAYEHHVECGGGAICASGRCRLPCDGEGQPEAASCRCRMDARLGLSVCTEGEG